MEIISGIKQRLYHGIMPTRGDLIFLLYEKLWQPLQEPAIEEVSSRIECSGGKTKEYKAKDVDERYQTALASYQIALGKYAEVECQWLAILNSE